MKEFLTVSSYAALFLTLAAYALGEFLKKKTKNALCNPLLIASALIIMYLLVSKTGVEKYREQTRMIGGLLTPATVCLAIPLHKQFSLLKRNAAAVSCGVCCGILSSLLCTLLLSAAFSLSHAEYVTFLPKSITTAIGMEVSAEYGGIVPVTVASIFVTGVFGNLIAEPLFRLLRIKEPIAKGVGLGTAAHALGTSKAMELGETEGAMSSLSLVVSGVLTVCVAPLFVRLF